MQSSRRAFTLVELLVVIGIIAVLIAILLPTLSGARKQAMSVTSLSNLRQIGMAIVQYRNENKGLYPVGAWQSMPGRPRHRWADSLYPYMKSTEIFMSPHLSEDERARMNKPFNHTCDQTANPGILPDSIFYGGYGYNYQYLGNGRTPGGIPAYQAREGSNIRKGSETIAVADTNGTMNGGSTFTSEGVYVVDPPLMSIELGSQGSRRSSAVPGPGQYGYSGGNDGDATRRSTPAVRNRGKVNVLFCDGHAAPMTLKEMDDYDGDGQPDNGWWNGKADATVR